MTKEKQGAHSDSKGDKDLAETMIQELSEAAPDGGALWSSPQMLGLLKSWFSNAVPPYSEKFESKVGPVYLHMDEDLEKKQYNLQATTEYGIHTITFSEDGTLLKWSKTSQP